MIFDAQITESKGMESTAPEDYLGVFSCLRECVCVTGLPDKNDDILKRHL